MGRPRVDATPITLRLPPDLLSRLDDWRKTEPDLPTRPEALRRIFSDWLICHGLLAPASDEGEE